ncbi:MAG: NADH:flavin oxidoreductase, partial [Planctomycetota bacterium]|nr:NADH:flavin oxidoreductase [Planctomycetota bacterium]
GFPKPEIFALYNALAEGEVGLIITGHFYVHPERKCSPGQAGLWSDRHIEPFKHLVAGVHSRGGVIVAQLNASALPPEAAAIEDLNAMVACFGAAAQRAMAAGFDGVQIHAAHGYFLSEFITPAANRRGDAYGGNAEGRRRLLLETVRACRQAMPANRLLLCKLGAKDGQADSLSLAEAIGIAQALAVEGLTAIEISCGRAGPQAQPVVKDIADPSQEAYFAPLAAAIKNSVSIPVILVGGLRSLAVMEKLVHDGVCDLVALCRPFIREPDLVSRLRRGAAARASCISCNGCFNLRSVRCAFPPRG